MVLPPSLRFTVILLSIWKKGRKKKKKSSLSSFFFFSRWFIDVDFRFESSRRTRISGVSQDFDDGHTKKRRNPSVERNRFWRHTILFCLYFGGRFWRNSIIRQRCNTTTMSKKRCTVDSTSFCCCPSESLRIREECRYHHLGLVVGHLKGRRRRRHVCHSFRKISQRKREENFSVVKGNNELLWWYHRISTTEEEKEKKKKRGCSTHSIVCYHQDNNKSNDQKVATRQL